MVLFDHVFIGMENRLRSQGKSESHIQEVVSRFRKQFAAEGLTNSKDLVKVSPAELDEITHFEGAGAYLQEQDWQADDNLPQRQAERAERDLAYKTTEDYYKQRGLDRSLFLRPEDNDDVNEKGVYGNTYLHNLGPDDSSESLADLGSLLAQGADPTIRNNNGRTPAAHLFFLNGKENKLSLRLRKAEKAAVKKQLKEKRQKKVGIV
jgi:hypothetical protein